MADDGIPRITWHGKDFAVITEIVKLGQIETSVQVPALDDRWLCRFIAALVACERIESANHIAPAHVLEMAACRWVEKGGSAESWLKYEIQLGVPKSRTRKPRSRMQPFLRWARGGEPDYDGRLARLSGAFDAWLAEKDRPDPYPRNGEPGTSQLAEWLRRNHGYQAVADDYYDRLDRRGSLREHESRTKTPDARACRFEPEAMGPGNTARWCPKCGKLPIPICEPASRYSEPNRTPRFGERSNVERVYVTPPPFFAALDSEFHFTPNFDPCPHPRPKGFDGLQVAWPKCVYCNCPFRKRDSTRRTGHSRLCPQSDRGKQAGKENRFSVANERDDNSFVRRWCGISLREALFGKSWLAIRKPYPVD